MDGVIYIEKKEKTVFKTWEHRGMKWGQERERKDEEVLGSEKVREDEEGEEVAKGKGADEESKREEESRWDDWLKRENAANWRRRCGGDDCCGGGNLNCRSMVLMLRHLIRIGSDWRARRLVITERWDGKKVKGAEQSRAHCTLRIDGNGGAAAGGLEDCRRLTCLICRRRHMGDPRLEKGGNLAEGRSGVLIQWPALQHQVVDLRGTGGRPLKGQAVGEASGVEARGVLLLFGTLLVSTVGAAARAAGTVGAAARRSVRRLVVDGTGLLRKNKKKWVNVMCDYVVLWLILWCTNIKMLLSLRYLFSVSWKRHSKKPINLLLRKSSKKL